MKINKHKYVTMDFILKKNNGELLDDSRESDPLSYIHGTGTLLAGLEDALEGKSGGDKISVSLSPEKAYGLRDESLMRRIKKDQFKDFDEINVGMQIHVQEEDFNRIMIITGIEDDMVALDGNHPLAGIDLDIDVEVKDVREATPEELEKIYTELKGCGGGCSDGCETC